MGSAVAAVVVVVVLDVLPLAVVSLSPFFAIRTSLNDKDDDPQHDLIGTFDSMMGGGAEVEEAGEGREGESDNDGDESTTTVELTSIIEDSLMEDSIMMSFDIMISDMIENGITASRDEDQSFCGEMRDKCVGYAVMFADDWRRR